MQTTNELSFYDPKFKLLFRCLNLLPAMLLTLFTTTLNANANPKLEIRNVELTSSYAEYDLYFVFDDEYVVQDGKVLGVRIHEYGSIYSFTASSLLEGRRTSQAGYGNGGSSKVFYIEASELAGVSEVGIARVRWEPSSQSATQERDEWTEVLANFGTNEYGLTAIGFSQELTFNARDVSLDSSVISKYEGVVTVDGALVALGYSPSNYSMDVDVNQIFSATFSEPIVSGVNEIVLSKLDGEIIEKFSPASSQLTILDEVMTLIPSAPLDIASAYKLNFQEDSVSTTEGKSYKGDAFVFYTSGFDASNGAKLEIRNVELTSSYAEYDLYFVFDDEYVVQDGKVLGVRIHEYGSIYSFTASSLLEGRRTSQAGYGNGGSSKVFYIEASELAGVSEVGIARVRWEPSSQSATQERDEWTEVLANFGTNEYGLTAIGFSQELTFNARDVSLDSSVISKYEGVVTVDGALVALGYSPSNYSMDVDVNQIFSATFSEPIVSGVNEIVLSKLDGEIIEKFSPASSQLTILDEVMTLIPSAPLDIASAYKLNFQEDSVSTTEGKSYKGDAFVFYTSGFDASNGAKLEIRNVELTSSYAEYDLYFVFDDEYVVQDGKVLGVRIHEYGSIYSFTASSLLEGRRTSQAGYGNGGSSKVFYIEASELAGVSEVGIARVRWEPSSQSATQERDEWTEVLANFGTNEYGLTAIGFSQELTFNARDVSLDSSVISKYEGSLIVDTDGDGITNSEDNDDDGDGITDLQDAFPLIGLGGRSDTDQDGYPDSCDSSCEESGMSADPDDDNDGVLDVNDAFPLDPSRSVDGNSAPTIAIEGAAAMTLNIGEVWNDPGVRAVDDEDGDLTTSVIVINPIDSSTPGSYTVEYRVTDSGGLTSAVTRTVTVIQPLSSGAIRFAAGQVIELPVIGTALTAPNGDALVVPTTATAASINVTGVTPGGSGFITVWPCGVARPLASNLNYVAGDVVPNGVLAPIGSNGKVCIYSLVDTDLVVDVAGWFEGDAFVGATPLRLRDTRETSRVTSAQELVLQVADIDASTADGSATRVPADVGAVALNVTVVSPDSAGFVTVYPCGTRPLASNVNYTAGQIVPNGVIAPVSADGKVCIYSLAPTDIIVDLAGWFPGDAFTAATPQRLVDTRDGTGGQQGKLIPTGQLNVPVHGQTLSVSGNSAQVPLSATAAALNVTIVNPERAGFATVWPCSAERPLASNLNFVSGQVVANNVIAPIGDQGSVCFYTNVPSDIIVDIAGYFSGEDGNQFVGSTPKRYIDTRSSLGPVPE